MSRSTTPSRLAVRHAAGRDHAPPQGRRPWGPFTVGLAALPVLALVSVTLGVADTSVGALLTGEPAAWQVVLHSRVPRTLALVLAGASLAVAGLVMQLLTRNGFVEPSTAGTMEFAGLGLLLCALYAPAAPVPLRMGLATLSALAGTWVFLRMLEAVPRTDILMVPLVGIVLGGVVSAISTFLAYRADLMQSLGAWMTGDFSSVLAGRYELLWIGGLGTVAALLLADRLTIAGLGQDISTTLGLNHRRVLALGMCLVAVITATTVATVGMLPFVGLVVPNLVVRVTGASARRSVPWAALGGALAVLLCDLIARGVVHPAEVPIGTVLGVVGGAAFLLMLLGNRRYG